MAKGVVIPEAMCWTVVRLHACKWSPLRIRIFTEVSCRSQQRILRRYRMTGNVIRPDQGIERRGRPRNLTAQDVRFLQHCVNDTADEYLDELQDDLSAICGRRVDKSTVWRTLKRCGYRMKQLTREAVERSVRKRARYIVKVSMEFQPNQLVFVDESSCDRRTTFRNRAWAIGGQRAVRKAFFVRGKRYSILPAISLEDGVLATEIIVGSFNSRKFGHFIDGLLSQMRPWPLPNSVIVMDNCAIHKAPEILDMITDRGMRYIFLPPYSPDYNPIELIFSQIKALIKRNGGIIRETMTSCSELDVRLKLREAVYSVTQEDVEGYFRKCSYIV